MAYSPYPYGLLDTTPRPTGSLAPNVADYVADYSVRNQAWRDSFAPRPGSWDVPNYISPGSLPVAQPASVTRQDVMTPSMGGIGYGSGENGSDGQAGPAGQPGSLGASRTASNNFGSIGLDRGGMFAASMLDPTGLVGLAGAGINANNVAAANAARDMIGLESLGIGQTLGGVLGLNDYGSGYVGQAKIGPREYGVSMGGVSRPGLFDGLFGLLGYTPQTQLTPTEALARQQAQRALEARAAQYGLSTGELQAVEAAARQDIASRPDIFGGNERDSFGTGSEYGGPDGSYGW